MTLTRLKIDSIVLSGAFLMFCKVENAVTPRPARICSETIANLSRKLVPQCRCNGL